MKKHICICAAIAALLFLSAGIVSAQQMTVLSEFAACRTVFAYSGVSSAGFYGFDGATLYAARVLPDICRRQVAVNGTVCAAAYDDENAYALCLSGRESYSLLTLSMDSGDWTQTPLALNFSVQSTSLAVADGEVFVICADGQRSSAAGICGGKTYRYPFSDGVNRLFINANAAYAEANDGGIYRLSKGSKTLCQTIPAHIKHVNAGCGWIYTEAGSLLSLSGASAAYPGTLLAVCADGKMMTFDESAVAAAALGSRMAVLKADGGCETFDFAQESRAKAGGNAAPSAGSTIIVSPGTTVAQLKRENASVLAVRNSGEAEVKSGLLKTGYYAQLTGGFVPVAVLGDVNGTGTVNSADISFLMGHFIGKTALNGSALAAADYNKDGVTDNRDLVLLARASE